MSTKSAAKSLIVTKVSAAKSQLETAIRLWFNDGDPVSIHALAASAQDCYRALAANAKIESPFEKWANAQSESFQKKLHDAQNFFKHGPNEFKGKIHLMPKHAEVLMFDATICHKRLFGASLRPPLLFLYGLRFCGENPDISVLRIEPGYERLKINGIMKVSRRQLFIQLFPVLLKAYRARTTAGSS